MDKDLQQHLITLAIGINFGETLLKCSNYDSCSEDMKSIYESGTSKLAQIISQHGWPGESLVGESGSDAAYIIARGAAINPILLKFFVNSLSVAVQNGEGKKSHEAGLMDLIRYYEGKPQLLGLIFDWKESGEFGAEVDDISRANQRRKELGLDTLEAATKLQLVKNQHTNHPKQIRQRKKQLDDWAKNIGWRKAG